MEKPAKRPRVPPITASWSMNVVFESFVIRSNVGLLMKMVTMCKVLSASHPEEKPLVDQKYGLHLLSEPRGLFSFLLCKRYILSSPFPFQGFLCWWCGWSCPLSHLKRIKGDFPWNRFANTGQQTFLAWDLFSHCYCCLLLFVLSHSMKEPE